MKKFLGTRIGVIVITLIACLIVFSSVAYAAGTFNKDVPATVQIKATNPDIAFYGNSQLTELLTTLDFGEVSSGTPETIHPWVKNVGNKNLSALTISSDLSSEIGSITGSIPALSIGQSVQIAITLNTFESLTDISPSISLNFSGSY